MITDEEILKIAKETRMEGYLEDYARFARAIYQLAWQRRGESDLSAIPSAKSLEQGDGHSDSDRKIVWNNALHEALKAIERNTGELK